MFSQQTVALAIIGHSHSQQDRAHKPGQHLADVAEPSTPLQVGLGYHLNGFCIYLQPHRDGHGVLQQAAVSSRHCRLGNLCCVKMAAHS